MKSKQGAISILWAAAVLVMPGCDDGDGDPMASGSTSTDPATETGASTGPDADSGSTGTPPADSGDSSGSPPVELSCDAYCGIYMDACQDFAEYANEQDCQDNCAQWPLGAPEDVAGDSLGCRTYHVTVASSTDAALHCPHAGPSGMEVCVAEDAPTCDLYCTRYFSNCEADLNLWADMDECMSTCAQWYPGAVTDDSGHSIGCRAYYANLAAGDAELHCPNAGPGGGDTCVFGN